MKATVMLALVGWIPLVLIFFATLPSRKALILGMIGGWLFLPVYIYKLKQFPEFSKFTASSYACLLGTILFDYKILLRYRLKWYDLPMLVWCLSPIITSIQNDLGIYDGISAAMSNTVIYGVPYFLGRLYFPDWASFRELVVAIFVGGLIYVPLCLFEIRFSPQLHNWLYGFFPTGFAQTVRFGGYRPMVFLQHGLACGMWMTSASLLAFWMWHCGTIKRFLGVPMGFWVGLLLLTTLLCKSTGGLILLVAGIGILLSIKYAKTPVLLLGVLIAAPSYMYIRASGQWDGQSLVALTQKYLGDERAKSLKTRIDAENLLAEHALEQPYFGWGRWNRNRVFDPKGKDMAPTDGLWIVALGEYGIVGLCGFTLMILLPPLLVWSRCPLKMWMHPGIAPAVAMAVLLSLYMLDNILNGMPDPIFTLALGGLAAIQPNVRRQVARRPVQSQASLAPPSAAYVAIPRGALDSIPTYR